ncbi:WASH complex subunit 3 [Thrips palmi]|uniref:WASH complex subunit 3 n=1 Tax=Thrips palmi TaxID=161013 RepID=A0A6P9ALB4_THRPL|nr:WASH complex subunit 3 [Thrips palmi]
MDPDGLPVIGAGVDYTQVGAIHQKRTLAFINYFVTSTVSFLNNFSRSCEVRLQKCESRIQKLEASLGILEAKLSSIPSLTGVTAEVVSSQDPSLEQNSTPNIPPEVPVISNEVEVVVPPGPPEVPSGMIAAKDHPTYKRFLRMVQVGVPEPAVRNKMQAEGLDPDILSNPNQLVSAPEPAATEDNSESESGTD